MELVYDLAYFVKQPALKGLIVLLLILTPYSSQSYCLLTHEAIVDASWKTVIEPRLLKQFPDATKEQLLEAHSYAYGGAIMPDIGYSPFGSMVYTDLVHNVRTGDYVAALIEEAETLDELAFALGSLAHYTGDNYGHQLGTNVAVPLVYPKVGKAFGDTVTYAQDHLSHSRMEFAFDVLQTARGNYASKNYHDFIGFNVSKELVGKAFFRTYGLVVEDVFKSLPLAISTYRWTIKSLLPLIVKTAWAKKKDEIRKLQPTTTAKNFSYRMKNRTYYHEYGRDHQKAGFFPTVFSVLIPVLPKIGPLAKLKFKEPTAEAEKLFIKSFDTTLVNYRSTVKNTSTAERISLENKTLDTGYPTAWGDYPIADDSYAELLLKLHKSGFENVHPAITEHILKFFKPAVAPKTKSLRKKWQEIRIALNSLERIQMQRQVESAFQGG